MQMCGSECGTRGTETFFGLKCANVAFVLFWVKRELSPSYSYIIYNTKMRSIASLASSGLYYLKVQVSLPFR